MDEKQPKLTEVEHIHEWKKFKQSLSPQLRTPEQIKAGMEYHAQSAYFVVLACEGCKKKKVVDYKVERY